MTSVLDACQDLLTSATRRNEQLSSFDLTEEQARGLACELLEHIFWAEGIQPKTEDEMFAQIKAGDLKLYDLPVSVQHP